MNLPIDTCENGECSFAIRGEYDNRVYAKNLIHEKQECK